MKKLYLLFLIQLFTLGAYAQYCLPGYSAGPTGGDSIVSIVSGTLTGNYPGSPSGYNNYTSLDTLVVSTGQTFTLTITNNPGFAEGVAVWLDYNQNNAFDANERVGFLNLTAGQVGTVTFTVPATAPIGFSRLRMVAAWGTQGNAINPCGNYVWGETEDYALFVRPPIANDMELASIVPYALGCGLSATSPVNVTLSNNGYNNVTSVPVSYSINGGTPITQTASGAYVAGSTNPFTFTTTANFSATNATFTLRVWVSLPGDQVSANDTAVYTFTTPPPVITTFPYLQNFESGQGGWNAVGANSTWAFGTPAKTTINSAGSGVNSWVTGGLGTGFYNSAENSQVLGPCFDFTSLTLPKVRLKVWWNAEFSWDGANLQSSIDGGTTWQNVGNFGDPNNWYTDNSINGNPGGSLQGWTGRGTFNGSQGWVVAENSLTGLAGQSNVKLRIAFGADFSVQDEGFAFDDIEIFEAPTRNIEMVSLDEPFSSCGLGASNLVKVSYTHLGSLPVNNINFSYRVNNGPVVTQNSTAVVNPGTTNQFTFTTPANLSTQGQSYNFTAWLAATGDTDASNDTVRGVVTNIPLVSTFPYNQTFEAGTGGWTTGGNLPSWALGTPAKTNIIGAAGGTKSWVTGGLGTGTYNAGEQSYVLGPCFNFTNLTNPIIKMDIWWFSESFFDGTALQASTDNGATWVNVGNFGDPNNWYNGNTFFGPGPGFASEGWIGSFAQSSGGWVEAKNFLGGLGGQSSVLLRIAFGADTFVQYDGFAFDNIQIYDSSPADMELVSIDAPLGSGCGLSANTPVSVTYFHAGSQPVSSINFSYQINGGTVVTENSTITVAPGATLQYNFVTPANLSTPGTTYNFNVWLNATGDTDNTNDSLLNYVITNIAPISVFPYIQDFDDFPLSPGFSPGTPILTLAENWENSQDDSPQDWATYQGQTPSFNAGPSADHTSGTGRYLYVEDSGFDNDSVILLTPCINLSGLASPRFSFWYWSHEGGNGANPANVNELHVDKVVNGVTTYDIIPPISNDIQAWKKVTIPVAASTGIVNFRFRVNNNNNFNFTHDIAIDDIMIQDSIAVDAGITQIIDPVTGCGLSAAEPLTVRINNFGFDTLFSVPVRYSVNGVAGAPATYTGTLLPQTSTIFTFPTTVNLSTLGFYTIKAYTGAIGDPNVPNDSATKVVENQSGIASFPYFENFEGGQGPWVAGGSGSTWAFGTPAKSVINSAGSGTKAWVTGGLGTGSYNNNEDSYVLGPCFDFSTLNAPIVRMKIWWNSEQSWDGSNLQGSTDGGLTWTTIGNFGDPNNWYNDNTINGAPGGVQIGWTGRFGTGSGGWVTAEHDMAGLANESNVKLRITFGADASVQDNGFAFDDIEIFEAPAFNAKLISYEGPKSGCGLLDTAHITVKYAHLGSQPITSINFGYRIGNGPVVTETSTLTVNPGDTLLYTYSTPADLGTPGTTYNVDVFLAATGDTDAANDSVNNVSVTHRPAITTFPYAESFDGPNFTNTPGFFFFGTPVIGLGNDWVNSQEDQAQDWAAWTGTSPSSTFFNTGPSADHTTGLASGAGAGRYLFAQDVFADFDSVILLSPCYDVSALQAPKFSFWYYSRNGNTPNAENFLHVDLIFNGDIIYDIIQPIGHKGVNWNFVEIPLTNYIGVVGFRFRAELSNNFGSQHDFAIDDIALVNVPDFDGGVTDLLSPLSGCGLTANQSVSLLVENLGADSISNFQVSYQLNGGTVFTTTVPDTLEPGGSAAVTFSGANFAAAGVYTVTAWTSGVAGDFQLFNDTLITTVTSIPTIATYPYFQDFESGQGGWSLDANSNAPSWAFGTPGKNVIVGASSGANAWVTGGLGTSSYNNNENSQVVGPCFNFSSISNPVISLDVWWQSESSWDGSNIQTSIDNGATWQTVGAVGDPINWYNDGSINGAPGGVQIGWSGRNAANGSQGWKTATHDLTGLGGQSSVLMRVTFGADGSVVDDGFAFDNIRIFDRQPNDVGVVAVSEPVVTSCSGDSIPIFVQVVNFGSATQTTVPVTVNITGTPTPTPALTGIYTGTLAPADTVTFLVGYANFNTPGTYNLYASTDLTGDIITSNDSTLGRSYVTLSETAPIVFNDSICSVDSASFTLRASSATATTIFWYDSAVGGNRVAIGDTFNTPVLTSNTTYYAQAVSPTFANVGPVDRNIGFGANYTFFADGIVFDALSDFKLRSVKVYPAGAGNIVVSLLNAVGTVLQTKTIAYGGTAVDTTVTLDFNIPAGTGYRLNANGTTTGGLYRNSSGALFPYTVNDVVRLTNTINGLGTSGFYYFFYNWSVEVLGCPSPRVPVTARFLPPVAVDLGADAVVCAGFVLNAAAPGIVSYEWNGDPNITGPTLAANTSGSYFVNVVNASGCTGADTINVTVLPSPTVDLGADTSACNSVLLDAGNPGATYAWSVPGQNSRTLSATQSGTYYVNVTQSGCTSTDTVAVSILPGPIVNLGTDRTTCRDITFNAGNAGSTYAWSNGATTQSVTVSAPASLSVVVGSANGCTDRDTVTLTLGATPVVNLGPDASICDSLILDAGANAGGSYLWSTGATTRSIVADVTNTYTVTVTDSIGCVGTDNLSLSVAYSPTADWTFAYTGVPLTFLFTNSSTAGSYLWDFGDGTTSTVASPTHTYPFDGSYEVSLIVSNDCGTDTFKTVLLNVSIFDENFSSLIEIYPNPNDGLFFVSSKTLIAKELVIEVYDFAGKKVLDTKLDDVFGGFKYQVDLTEQAEGAYLMRISDGDRVAIKRIVRK